MFNGAIFKIHILLKNEDKNREVYKNFYKLLKNINI